MAASLQLAETHFPEFFQAEAPSAEATRLEASALRVTLPEEAGGVMELSTRGYLFQVREEGRGKERLSASGGAAFYGAQRFWKPVGASTVEGERQWRTERVEEFLVLAEAGGEHRARYVVTVPEGVSQVRDAGDYLEFLEASGQPVVRMHVLLARDGAGHSRQGEVRLLGARVLEASASGELTRYALEGRTLGVEMSLSLEGLTGPVVIDPAWSSTGAMATPRILHTATLLASGKVLVAGGLNSSASALATAELYDPASGTWSATGSMPTAHQGHTATLLQSGKVLVVGGGDQTNTQSFRAELYDPATGSWTATANTLRARLDHTATLLPSGKVLVVGDPYSSSQPELYDPATGTWTLQSAMVTPRRAHGAALLASGKVLIAGGLNGSHTQTLSAELYDPATGSFSATGSMVAYHSKLVALPSGKVLALGSSLTACELYDPATGTWSSTGKLLSSNSPPPAVLLDSGRVLVMGPKVELYDPATDTWRQVGSLVQARSGYALTRLAEGKALVAGGSVSGTYLASVEVYNPANTAPVAQASSNTTSEEKAVVVGLLATDPDADALTYAVVSQPANGTVSVSGTGPLVTYTPALNFHGTDSFTFKANDGALDSNVVTFTLTVTPVNDAPVVQAVSRTTLEDTPVSLTLLGTDVEGDGLTYVFANMPVKGTLTGTAPNLTYTPNANATGTDSFSYRANDGKLDSNQATVTLTITPQNDAPVASALSKTGNEDTTFSLTLSATDVDGDLLTYGVVQGPANGTLSGTAPNLTYRPATHFNGTDSFTFKANDGTVDSNVATFSLTVTPVNDGPVASNLSKATNEDTPVSLTLTATDPENDTLTYLVVSGPTRGTLTGTAPNLTYTPNANFNGTDSFSFRANDGRLNSNTATFTLSVAAVNDAPVATGFSSTTKEDTQVFVGLNVTDSDADTLTYVIVQAPASGTLTGTAPHLTYTPHANFHGTDSFTFKANDGTVDSNVATASLTVTSVNDAPRATNLSLTTAEDTDLPVVLQGTDAEGDMLTYTVLSQPHFGTLSGTAPNLVYTPGSNTSGTDSFTYEVNDGSLSFGSATVSITITPVNDAPVAVPWEGTTSEDTAVSLRLIVVDAEDDALSFQVVEGPAHGTLSGTGPLLTYTPGPDFHGTDSFTFKANDGTLDSNVATFSLNVMAENDAPVAQSLSRATGENTAVSVVLAATDAEGDALTYTVVTPPAHGTLSGSAPELTYTPNAGFSGTDSFTFKANDGTVDSNVATVSLSVARANTAPVARDVSATGAQGQPVQVQLAATDAEGNALTYTVVTPPAHGTLSGNGPALTYTPQPGFSGSDSFTFKASDGELESNVATASLTVTPAAEAPTTGCGCSGASTAGASGAWGLALLGLGLVSRRRRGSAR